MEGVVLEDFLAHGRYGEIFLASNSQGARFVVKKVDLISVDRDTKQLIQNEVEIQKSLSHPNIVALFSSSCHTGFQFILLEFCNAGDFRGYLADCIQNSRRSSEETVLLFLSQVLRGLSCIHDTGIVHRDLKPENILLHSEGDDIRLKIADFGISWNYTLKGPCTSYTGTPIYMAPEVISGMQYGYLVDVWSLGCVVMEMCNLQQPFDFDDFAERILENPLPEVHPQYSLSLKTLVTLMMERDPLKRPTTSQLLQLDLFHCQSIHLPPPFSLFTVVEPPAQVAADKASEKPTVTPIRPARPKSFLRLIQMHSPTHNPNSGMERKFEAGIESLQRDLCKRFNLSASPAPRFVLGRRPALYSPQVRIKKASIDGEVMHSGLLLFPSPPSSPNQSGRDCRLSLSVLSPCSAPQPPSPPPFIKEDSIQMAPSAVKSSSNSLPKNPAPFTQSSVFKGSSKKCLSRITAHLSVNSPLQKHPVARIKNSSRHQRVSSASSSYSSALSFRKTLVQSPLPPHSTNSCSSRSHASTPTTPSSQVASSRLRSLHARTPVLVSGGRPLHPKGRSSTSKQAVPARHSAVSKERQPLISPLQPRAQRGTMALQKQPAPRRRISLQKSSPIVGRTLFHFKH